MSEQGRAKKKYILKLAYFLLIQALIISLKKKKNVIVLLLILFVFTMPKSRNRVKLNIKPFKCFPDDINGCTLSLLIHSSQQRYIKLKTNFKMLLNALHVNLLHVTYVNNSTGNAGNGFDKNKAHRTKFISFSQR